MTSRPSTAAPILAVLAIVLVTLSVYLTGYVRLGYYAEWKSEGRFYADRGYRHQWQATLFSPTAWIEGKLRGVQTKAYFLERPIIRPTPLEPR